MSKCTVLARTAIAVVVFVILAANSGAIHAATQTLVGVTSVTFAWTPAGGSPTGYTVYRSLNGAALQPYTTTSSTTIAIPAAAGQQIAIAVSALGYGTTGALQNGPLSPLSDTISVLATPTFPVTGSWLLRCGSCPTLVRRSRANASAIQGQAAGPTVAWRALGSLALSAGRKAFVFQNRFTGDFALWGNVLLAAIPGAVGTGRPGLLGVGGADWDGDGTEDFLTQQRDTGLVEDWRLGASGFAKIASWAAPTASSVLAAARDFNRDGKIDLLWQDPVAGTLDLWKLASDPTLGKPITSILAAPPVRIASGMTSDAVVAATGDFDGDGYPDVLWRFGNGRLAITYLTAGRARSYVALPSASDDASRSVIGSVELDGSSGSEIALEHDQTGEISILDPSSTSTPVRVTILSPGSQWRLIDVGS